MTQFPANVTSFFFSVTSSSIKSLLNYGLFFGINLDHVFLLTNLSCCRLSILTAILIIFLIIPVYPLRPSHFWFYILIFRKILMQTRHCPILLYTSIFWTVIRIPLLIGFVSKSKIIFKLFCFHPDSCKKNYINTKIVEFVKHLLRFLLLFFVIVFQKKFQSGLHPIKNCSI